MRLLYDNLIYYLQINGGISTYWYELTSRFLREEDILLSFYEPKRNTSNVLRKKLDILPDQIINRIVDVPLIERVLRLPRETKDHIFHSSYFRLPIRSPRTRIVTTIHDFTHEKYYNGARAWSHYRLKQAAIKASDRIITVSQHTKRDLLDRYPAIDAANIKVIYHGASADYRIDPTAEQNNVAPFFLFVGSRERYKNFDFAIKLTKYCPDFELHIVGNALSSKEHQVLSEALGNRYRSFENINNKDLNYLYNTAYCLLYPSSNEGFGIPLLEAMQAGCPFIALNSSSIPEVAGDAGILLPSLDLDEALAAVAYVGNNRNILVSNGLKRAKQFSWDDCFRETYSLYRSIAS